jgi:Prp8 binding protein
VSYSLTGHDDTITGTALSPDGSYILSNAMDNTVRIWDVRPFAAGDRCLKRFEGAPHGYEKNLVKPAWSKDGSRIACGSADRSVVVWDTTTRKILYKLPGHKGCVNEVAFHPTEPILASCSTDRQIFLGEISHASAT